jgi:hypothetical protein
VKNIYTEDAESTEGTEERKKQRKKQRKKGRKEPPKL